MSHHLEDECPRCFYRTDRVMALDERCSPAPGDITLCLNCGHLFLFDARLQMREVTEAESQKIMGLPDTLHPVVIIKKLGPLNNKPLPETRP